MAFSPPKIRVRVPSTLPCGLFVEHVSKPSASSPTTIPAHCGAGVQVHGAPLWCGRAVVRSPLVPSGEGVIMVLTPVPFLVASPSGCGREGVDEPVDNNFHCNSGFPVVTPYFSMCTLGTGVLSKINKPSTVTCGTISVAFSSG